MPWGKYAIRRVARSVCPITRYPSGVVAQLVFPWVPGLLGRIETTSKATCFAGVVAEALGAGFCATPSGITAKNASDVALQFNLRIVSASFTRGILQCTRIEPPEKSGF